MSFWGTAEAVVSDYVLPAAHTAVGIAEMGMGPLQGAVHAAGRAIPYIGAAIGAGQMIGHGIAAYNSTGDARYDHIGSAVMGMLGGIPAVGAYVGGAELAFNAGATIAGAIDSGGNISEAHDRGGLMNQWVGRLIRGAHGALTDDPSDDYNVATPRAPGGHH
jgi:hypothetical protein